MSNFPLLVSFAEKPAWYQVALYRQLARLLDGRFLALLTHGGHADGVRDQVWGGLIKNTTGLLEGYPHHIFNRRPGATGEELRRLQPAGIAKKLAELRPEAVLVNDHGGSAAYRKVIRATKRLGARLILRSTPYDLSPSSFSRHLIRHTYLRARYARFDAFCAVGTLPQLHFERFSGRPEDVYRSPYCADDFYLGELAASPAREALRREFKAEYKISKGERIVVTIGRLVELKRFDWLIRAFLRSHPMRPSRLVILGDGPQRNVLEALARTAPPDTVLLLGAGSRRDVARVLAASDIFTLASRSETWGVVVNEALLFGLPCVVSDRVASTYDLVLPGITGYRFRWNDEDDFVRGLLTAHAMCDDGLNTAAFDRLREANSSEAAALGVLKAARLNGLSLDESLGLRSHRPI